MNEDHAAVRGPCKRENDPSTGIEENRKLTQNVLSTSQDMIYGVSVVAHCT